MLANLIDGLSLSYQRAGEGYLLPFWLVLLALTPLTVLIHELGHGVVGMAVTRRPVKIHVRLGSGWCALTGGSLTARQYAMFVAAGPLASLGQALVGLWLAASAEPGSDTQWVLFAGAVAGALALTSLVPMDHRGRSDGQRLLEVGGWISGGPRPDWYPPPDDPHVATSVAPPG